MSLRQRSQRQSSTRSTDRAELLLKLERVTDVPLMILAAGAIPLLAELWFWQSGDSARAVAIGLYLLIWIVFISELLIRIGLSLDRAQYIKLHWFDVLVALFPPIRPLRIPLVVCFGTSAYGRVVRFAHVDFLVSYAITLVLWIATLVNTVERGHDSTIDSFQDALWWSIATVTTVGYGDVVPVSAAGRALAYVLMLGGIGLFAALTANLASMLTRREDPEPAALTALTEEVRQLRETVERLEERDPPQ